MLTVSLLPSLAIMALCGVCLMYFGQWRAQRRLQSVMRLELSRIFEQIDLLRLDALHSPSAADAAPVATSRPVTSTAPRQHALTLSNGEAYAAALELAARGADHSELTARCGLGRDEARILVAMQGANRRRVSVA
jgi:hypothetical protein